MNVSSYFFYPTSFSVCMKSLVEFYIAPTWTPFKIFNVHVYISELKLRWMTFCDYFMIFVFKCSLLIQLRLYCIIVLKCSVVAKKMFSQLRFSLSQSLFLMRDLEQILWAQSFGTPWMQGYQTLCLQNGACNTQKENKPNICSRQYFVLVTLLIMVAGSQEFLPNFLFRCRRFDVVQIWNDCMCFT